MVSTYGDIAVALGDKVAARAVGDMISRCPATVDAPCYRVVYADGRVGQGSEARADRLRAEGVEVRGGSVADLSKRRFTSFKVRPLLKELREEQNAVRDKVISTDDLGRLERVGGLDISYSGERAFAALTVFDWASGELVEERVRESVVRFPYIPTFLSYREMPALRPLIDAADGMLYLIDGQGTLHPRGAGIASHIGVCLGVATVGAAKSSLFGQVEEDGEEAPILVDGEVRGCRLGSGKKATYVSVGHRVSLGTGVKVCKRFLEKGIPRPLRRAHDLANEARRAAV